MSDKQCIHHWIIDVHNVGYCIRCGAVKNFAALLKKRQKELSDKQAEIELKGGNY